MNALIQYALYLIILVALAIPTGQLYRQSHEQRAGVPLQNPAAL